jgi:hypothetical protein
MCLPLNVTCCFWFAVFDTLLQLLILFLVLHSWCFDYLISWIGLVLSLEHPKSLLYLNGLSSYYFIKIIFKLLSCYLFFVYGHDFWVWGFNSVPDFLDIPCTVFHFFRFSSDHCYNACILSLSPDILSTLLERFSIDFYFISFIKFFFSRVSTWVFFIISISLLNSYLISFTDFLISSRYLVVYSLISFKLVVCSSLN